MFDVRSVFAALRRRPGPRNAFERGVVALDAGRHEEALDEFEAARREAPEARDEAAAHNKRGVVLIALVRRHEALEAFSLALDRDAECAPALVNIGNVLLEDDHVLDAVDYYEAAIRADAGYPMAHRNLGVAFKRLGRRGDAVRAFRAAARLEGRQPLRRA
ncbi:MAG: tetratricopeptide repeat protein [Candidatus Eremiobacteraeota bacterium]|nr:tetratricopeptide repeat protein [Candidatus Eremiobacteraeota bacterium]